MKFYASTPHISCTTSSRNVRISHLGKRMMCMGVCMCIMYEQIKPITFQPPSPPQPHHHHTLSPPPPPSPPYPYYHHPNPITTSPPSPLHPHHHPNPITNQTTSPTHSHHQKITPSLTLPLLSPPSPSHHHTLIPITTSPPPPPHPIVIHEYTFVRISYTHTLHFFHCGLVELQVSSPKHKFPTLMENRFPLPSLISRLQRTRLH